ncbi:hypothetical protein DJ564_13375 [Pseudomonas sp. 31-12]|uniref:hypothetical protein n=1 Tax=Pseudomonas sp. 31-12 TaxID=2201356 RepID=UPI000D6CCBB4|nr:hypothetical protein [Pseudomonas sp. 31-12]AWM91744.1 hypothetical protein DJ564_13375 [Pseudomonas sp. 31-12]
MDLDPLKIKEAIDGVITMSAVEEGGTAIIPPLTNPRPNDECEIFINGKPVVSISFPEPDDEERTVLIPKQAFLDNSGQGPVPFRYVIYSGGMGNDIPSKSVDYKIQLA